MKKQEIVNRLSAMLELNKAPEIKTQIESLIADLNLTEETEGKLHYFVTVQEMKIDPAQKYPRQMIECHKILSEAGKVGETLSRDEVLKLIEAHAERLQTRQTAERIYSFYQKRMEEDGWLIRSKTRL
jgi:hypothetical protein